MGRWDDLFILLDTDIAFAVGHLVKRQLTLDMEDAIDNKAISLLGKWMPSENAHSQLTKNKASWLKKYLGMNSKQYRQMLSKLRAHLNVLERLMSANRWDEIEFDKIPSKAGLVYRNAFARRDIIAKKYEAFAKDKNTTVNANTLYPYEVVNKVVRHVDFWDELNIEETERAMLNKYWENLPDYFEGKEASMMCVVDTSGSMHWGSASAMPIDVAISLGLYCAEHMAGPFGGKYISFASRPQLIETTGIDFCDKVNRIYQTNLCDNTNLTAVFNLLLHTALKPEVKISDIPETIVVISDMEIDDGTWGEGSWTKDNTVTEMEKIRQEWKRHGLELPKLVYWNVNARNNTILDKGPNVSFVSGCSPIIFKQVLTGKTGIELMMEVLMSERYKWILA